jgi:hypothetical protein
VPQSLAYSWANFLVATLSAIQNDFTPYRPATLVIFSLLVLFLWTVTNVTRIESLVCPRQSERKQVLS